MTSVHDTRWPCSPHRVHELWLAHFSVFKVNNMQICTLLTPSHKNGWKFEFFEASGWPVERSRLLDDRLCRRRQPSNSKGTPSNVSTRVRNLVCMLGITLEEEGGNWICSQLSAAGGCRKYSPPSNVAAADIAPQAFARACPGPFAPLQMSPTSSTHKVIGRNGRKYSSCTNSPTCFVFLVS